MHKNLQPSFSKSLLCYAAFSASFCAPCVAHASVIPYECSLSGAATSNVAACSSATGGGLRTNTTAVKNTNGNCDVSAPFCAAVSNTPTAVAPIEAWNVCRWVDNHGAEAIFVPFKSALEWSDFRAAAPGLLGGSNTVNLVHCAVPYADNGAPATTTFTPPFAGCTSITVNNPNVYGRTNDSLFPNPAIAGPGFSCHAFNTTMMSRIQWKASDVETVAAHTPSWTYDTTFRYSPDLTLGTPTPVVSEGSAVTLQWTIAPYVPGDSLTCSVSPGGWGPDANGFPRSGTSTIILSATAVYTLTCTESPSLTSVASVALTSIAPPPGCVATDGGGYYCSGSGSEGSPGGG